MPSPSHSPSVTRAAELPAALTAFLRGAERRAFVFLWLQGGDAAMAEKALAAAIRAFPGPAANLPMAEWPDRFWRLLAASPLLAAWKLGWRPRWLHAPVAVLAEPRFWLVLLPAYWVARNLPWFPFTLLAPG